MAKQTKFKPFLIFLNAPGLFVAASVFWSGAFAIPQNDSSFEVPIQKCWEHRVENPAVDVFAFSSGKIFYSDRPGRITAIDAGNAAVIWSTELGGEIASDLAVANDGVFVVSYPSVGPDQDPRFATVRRLSASTGITAYSSPISYSGHFYLHFDGGSLIAVGDNGRLTAVNDADGTILWNRSLGDELNAIPVFHERSAAIVTKRGRVALIETRTGDAILEFRSQFAGTALAVLGDRAIVVGDERGNVRLRVVGEIEDEWIFKTGGGISNVTPIATGILITSNDNFVYLVTADRGKVNWKRRLPGRIIGGPLNSGDFVVAAIAGESLAYLIDPLSGKLLNQFSLGESDRSVRTPLALGKEKLGFAELRSIVGYGINGCETNQKAATP
jgi:outer membrane protein assembly factor BamB